MQRRDLLKTAVGVVAGSMSGASFAQASKPANDGKTYVLLHGAFHGGWCWNEVANNLRQRGHTVHTPTLTGAGERRHLISKNITLDTWGMDIVNVLRYEELSDVILVGHSFGGLTISGVADSNKDRLRHLVYLDSLMLKVGQSAFDGRPAADVEKATKLAMESSGGISVPPPPPAVFGVTDKKAAQWAAELMTPFPLSAYQSKLALKNPISNGVPATYIACSGPSFAPLEPSHRMAKSLGWTYQEIASGHDAMLISPEDLASMLAAIG